MQIRDRIKELRRVKASDLLPNPKNWRQHPKEQQDALRGVLAEIGWADAALVRETPEGLQLIDGHCRAEVAPGATIPVLVLDVSEAEADKILATHDPLAAMAGTNPDALQELLGSLETQSQALQEMLEGMMPDEDSFEIDTTDFPALPTDSERFHTISFTLSNEQKALVEEAIKHAKTTGESEGNANGWALATVCEVYLGQR